MSPPEGKAETHSRHSELVTSTLQADSQIMELENKAQHSASTSRDQGKRNVFEVPKNQKTLTQLIELLERNLPTTNAVRRGKGDDHQHGSLTESARGEKPDSYAWEFGYARLGRELSPCGYCKWSVLGMSIRRLGRVRGRRADFGTKFDTAVNQRLASTHTNSPGSQPGAGLLIYKQTSVWGPTLAMSS